MPKLSESEGGKIKPVNMNESFTVDQIRETRKCARDPIYFITKYVKIVSKYGAMDFNLFEYQRRLIRCYMENRYSINMLSRQCGKCVTSLNSITKYGKKVLIKTLVPLSFRERILTWLDERKVGLARFVALRSRENAKG